MHQICMFRGNVKISMSDKKNLIPFVSLLPPPNKKLELQKMGNVCLSVQKILKAR